MLDFDPCPIACLRIFYIPFKLSLFIGTPNSISKLDRDPSGTPFMIVGASDCRIRRLKLVRFLGLQVDDTLTWSDHIDYISTKIEWGIGVIKKTSKFLDKTLS